MKDFERMNQLMNVGLVQDTIDFMVKDIDDLKVWLENVESEPCAKADRIYLESIQKWLKAKRRFVFIMNDCDEDDFEPTKEAE